jgi:hypothetical protein
LVEKEASAWVASAEAGAALAVGVTKVVGVVTVEVGTYNVGEACG